MQVPRLYLLIWIVSAGWPFKDSAAILHGQSAKTPSFPHQVQLTTSSPISPTNRSRCGGSIISRFWVLTAAHCVIDNETGKKWQSISVSTRDGGSGFSPSSVEGIALVHSYYNNTTLSNDIALIRVRSPFRFSTTIRPNRLDTQTSELKGTAIVSGTGWLGEEGQNSAHLQWTSVPLMPRDYFANSENHMGPVRFDPERQLCTDGNFTATCKGDSGGALTFQGRQIGIVSYGSMGCAPSKFTVYTRVSAYIDWINGTCQGCLAEPNDFDFEQYSPKPVQRPKKEVLATQVYIYASRSVETYPPSIRDRTCLGTIISASWVLTSVECFHKHMNATLYWVHPTLTNGSDDSQWTRVKRTIVTAKLQYFGLLELQEELRWSEKVLPAKLDRKPFDGSAGTAKMLAVGPRRYRKTKFRYVNLNTASSEACAELLDDDDDSIGNVCSLVENYDGDEFSWLPGNPIISSDDDGLQIGVSRLAGTTANLYLEFPRISGYIDEIRTLCNGCLNDRQGDEVTRGLSSITQTFKYIYVSVGGGVSAMMRYFSNERR